MLALLAAGVRASAGLRAASVVAIRVLSADLRAATVVLVAACAATTAFFLCPPSSAGLMRACFLYRRACLRLPLPPASRPSCPRRAASRSGAASLRRPFLSPWRRVGRA